MYQTFCLKSKREITWEPCFLIAEQAGVDTSRKTITGGDLIHFIHKIHLMLSSSACLKTESLSSDKKLFPVLLSRDYCR